MAFIALRRSRNTSGYYLVESYRDEVGRSRKRTLCYLGREQDGTDTLAKALAHWQRNARKIARELRTAAGPRKVMLRERKNAAAGRIAVIKVHIRRAAAAAAEQKWREQQAEAERRRRERLAEQAEHWQAIERLKRQPSAEHSQAAKRAFRFLALRLHPDQGGSHEEFIRLKDAYERAEAAWRRMAG
ncbi:J domain-containing protein [Paludisphaera borealis]|uniref:J domain-containing protein n=1 Tax=Paludisphaera borealis TaxID=1387353 RepID=A0A1U7CI62_9BACT|nr:J domain-containing protein [Paludisphaera borealis]APW58622.1 hypothetical protein BSF38_00020 [Paludisphaera borealis]